MYVLYVLDYRQLGVFIQNLILLSLCNTYVINGDNGLTLSIELDSCGGIANHHKIVLFILFLYFHHIRAFERRTKSPTQQQLYQHIIRTFVLPMLLC